jgi:hypothetical protein
MYYYARTMRRNRPVYPPWNLITSSFHRDLEAAYQNYDRKHAHRYHHWDEYLVVYHIVRRRTCRQRGRCASGFKSGVLR